MNAIVAKRCTRVALPYGTSSASDQVDNIEEEALIYSEEEKWWIGPVNVMKIDYRMRTVLIPDTLRH